MLNFDISPLIFILVNVLLCAAQGNYIVENESNYVFGVYLNEIYVTPDGSGIDVPKTNQDLEVKVIYKSRFDGKVHTRLCSNHWYWETEGNQDLNNYYIATGSVKERSESADRDKIPEFVDLSKVCLYQTQEHFEDEHIVESKDPRIPNARKKKMCCEDKSFNGPNTPYDPNTPVQSSSSSILGTGTEEGSAAIGELVPDQQRTPTGSEAESNPVRKDLKLDEVEDDLSNFDRRLKPRNQKNRVEAER